MRDNLITISPAQRLLGAFNMLMMVPDNHVLFIGPVGCARHGFEQILMTYHRQISFITLTDQEVIYGDFEGIIEDAIGELLERVQPRPKAITIYAGCQMEFLVVDFVAMQKRFEKIYNLPVGSFIMNRMLGSSNSRVFIDMYRNTFGFLRSREQANTVNLLGSIAYLERENEIGDRLLSAGLGEILTLKAMQTFEDFQRMAASKLNIIIHPDYLPAARDMEENLAIPWIYLPVTYDLEEVIEQYQQLGQALGRELDIQTDIDQTRARISATLELVGNQPLAFNLIGIYRPFSMLQALVKMGFNIVGMNQVPYTAYKDPEQLERLDWLKVNSQIDLSRNDRLEHRPAHETEKIANHMFEGAYVGFAAINNLMNMIEGAYRGDEQAMVKTDAILF